MFSMTDQSVTSKRQQVMLGLVDLAIELDLAKVQTDFFDGDGAVCIIRLVVSRQGNLSEAAQKIKDQISKSAKLEGRYTVNQEKEVNNRKILITVLDLTTFKQISY